jgi:hypothetical protein
MLRTEPVFSVSACRWVSLSQEGDMSDEQIQRIQTALERRIATYSLKQKLSDPLADDDCNKYERYAFAVECFEVFAHEAGLKVPEHIYATDLSERNEA